MFYSDCVLDIRLDVESIATLHYEFVDLLAIVKRIRIEGYFAVLDYLMSTIEAPMPLTPLDRNSRTKIYKDSALSRLFC